MQSAKKICVNFSLIIFKGKVSKKFYSPLKLAELPFCKNILLLHKIINLSKRKVNFLRERNRISMYNREGFESNSQLQAMTKL